MSVKPTAKNFVNHCVTRAAEDLQPRGHIDRNGSGTVNLSREAPSDFIPVTDNLKNYAASKQLKRVPVDEFKRAHEGYVGAAAREAVHELGKRTTSTLDATDLKKFKKLLPEDLHDDLQAYLNDLSKGSVGGKPAATVDKARSSAAERLDGYIKNEFDPRGEFDKSEFKADIKRFLKEADFSETDKSFTFEGRLADLYTWVTVSKTTGKAECGIEVC